ncbi:MAG: phosphoribosylamine--glycine ligase [Chloroflexi bacterium RBG_13_53_26]|nr:MAG: phosphoribosylamine--glycine ligase [Chloroflexi bacterium RBG_13_53_26]
MKIMVIGNGAREHALAWKLKESPQVDDLYAAPGNAGTAAIARNLDVPATDIEALSRAVRQHEIDLTVVGPEAPLASGIVDLFQSLHLPVFGPTRAATQIESSKVFSRELIQKYGIPCAQGMVFSSYPQARDYVKSQPIPLVIKADGLAAGKGVVVATSREQALEVLSEFMERKTLGAAGNRVIVEECLNGQEVSLLAFTDGRYVRSMVPACDYKRVFDSDRGPNTGGMGSYSPPGFFDQSDVEKIQRTILEPAVRAMAAEGMPYKGVLYVGLMVNSGGVKVLEFNARFGDPETQAIIPRLKTDLVDIILAVINGTLDKMAIEWSDEACVGVVMASGGYPGKYQTGFSITGLDDLDSDILVFHAGTAMKNGVITNGGRVLTVVASGKSLKEARNRVYANIPRINFQGCHYRRDIAAREIA